MNHIIKVLEIVTPIFATILLGAFAKKYQKISPKTPFLRLSATFQNFRFSKKFKKTGRVLRPVLRHSILMFS